MKTYRVIFINGNQVKQEALNVPELLKILSNSGHDCTLIKSITEALNF